MGFKNTERWNFIKMSNNIIPKIIASGKKLLVYLKICVLIHERSYYYFACTMVVGASF